jgi:hypothetical protein
VSRVVIESRGNVGQAEQVRLQRELVQQKAATHAAWSDQEQRARDAALAVSRRRCCACTWLTVLRLRRGYIGCRSK